MQEEQRQEPGFTGDRESRTPPSAGSEPEWTEFGINVPPAQRTAYADPAGSAMEHGYQQRLIQQVWRESEVVNSATSSSSCLGGLVVYTFFRVFSILLEVVGIPVTDYAGFLPIISLLAIAVSLGAWSLLKKPLQGYYTEFRATAYRKACSELRHGDLLVRLIDGDWVDGLMERINGSFGMRWLVPQRPGKLEDFAVWGACFWDALQDLGSQRPVGRLNLWRGVINHVMLQQKLDRCCCILYFIPGIPLNIPLWIFFSNLYVQRSARMTALVDYLTRRRNLLLE